MYQGFIAFLDLYSIPDLDSAVGVLISIIGFMVTIWTVFRSKSAALRAERAASETRDRIKDIDAIYDFSTTLATIEEIMRLQRERVWRILPDKYQRLRMMLLELQEHHRVQLGGPDVLQDAITRVRQLEKN